MSRDPSIKRNIAYNSFYNVLIILIPLLLSPYVSRVLGVEGVGIYSFTFTIANYFKRVSMLGMEKYGNRSISLVKEDDKKRNLTFWGVYKVQFIWSVFCLAVYVFYLVMINGSTSAACQIIFVLSALFDVSWYFLGEEKFRTRILISSICKIISVILIFSLIKNASDLNKYIIIMGSSYLVPHIIIFAIAIVKEKYVHNNFSEIINIVKGTLILFVPVIAVTIYKSMDKLMLGVMCETPIENGLYENAEKILHVPIAAISAVSSVLMPRMTRLYRDKNEGVASSLIYLTMRYAAFMSIACACGLTGISVIFSNVFWGEEFSGCAILLAMFSISIPFMSFAEIIRTQFIIPNKQDKTYIIAVCLGALVNLIVNGILIPRLGAKGAVIGTIFAEATVCVYQALMVRDSLAIRKYAAEFIKYLPAGSIMMVIIFAVSTKVVFNVLNLLLIVLLGGILFCCLVGSQIFVFEKNTWYKLKNNIVKLLRK